MLLRLHRIHAFPWLCRCLLEKIGKHGGEEYSIFLELRSPLVWEAPPLTLGFLAPLGAHGTPKDASRAPKTCKNAGLGGWGVRDGGPPCSSLFPHLGASDLIPPSWGIAILGGWVDTSEV